MVPVSYIICTRDRPDELRRTLEAIAALPPHDMEVVVADNASQRPPQVPKPLGRRLSLTIAQLGENRGAAARNVAARVAGGEWLVMLDDDSCPLDTAFLGALARAPADVLAIAADIHLPAQGRREAGGLPEVFVGCGAAIRREAFAAAGGYDPTFGYYVEEYDLAARLLAMGGRMAFEPAFGVAHQKVATGRDMDAILRRLVRNNGWMLQRWAPEDERRERLREMRRRYRAIAAREGAMRGFAGGLAELRSTIAGQSRTPLARELWDRFTGLAHARAALQGAWWRRRFATAALVERGKHDWAVARALEEMGVRLVPEGGAERLVVATLSPGPMLDALEARRHDPRLLAPWTTAQRALHALAAPAA